MHLIPVLRGHNRHGVDGEILVQTVKCCGGAASAAGDHCRARLATELFSRAVKKAIEKCGRLPGRTRIVDRGADDNAVKFVQPCGKLIYAVVKDTWGAVLAFTAGDAARDGLLSDLEKLRGKPGAAVVSCRRGGASAAFDRLNKYFSINSMPIVTSQYWNQVHGNTPEEVRRDEEGLQTMRTLGENMAWLLRCIAAGKAAGIAAPNYEAPVRTNFIR